MRVHVTQRKIDVVGKTSRIVIRVGHVGCDAFKAIARALQSCSTYRDARKLLKKSGKFDRHFHLLAQAYNIG